MKNIYLANKDKTKILTVNMEGDYEFVDINEELFHEISRVVCFDENTKGIRRVYRDYNHNVLYDSKISSSNENTKEISYNELLNILIRNA